MKKMIVPTAHLLPDLCAYLSVRDIRALMCVSMEMAHNMRALTRPILTDEHISYDACMIVRTVTSWPLGIIISDIVRFDFDDYTVRPNIVPHDYTGMINISRVNQCAVYSICASDGIVDGHALVTQDTVSSGTIYRSIGCHHFATYINAIMKYIHTFGLDHMSEQSDIWQSTVSFVTNYTTACTREMILSLVRAKK